MDNHIYTNNDGIRVGGLKMESIDIVEKVEYSIPPLNEPAVYMSTDGGYIVGVMALKDILVYAKNNYPQMLAEVLAENNTPQSNNTKNKSNNPKR